MSEQSPIDRTPEKCRAGLAVANEGKPLAILNGDTSAILERLRNGERVPVIAQELGIGTAKVYEWLIRNNPEEWAAVSAGRALTRLDQAEADLDDAETNVEVSKARESHRMGQWTLERVARQMYGETKNGNGDVTVQVLIQRDGSTDTKVIEGG